MFFYVKENIKYSVPINLLFKLILLALNNYYYKIL